MSASSQEAYAAGFSKWEAFKILDGVRMAAADFTVALEGKRRSGEDRLWFRLYGPGTVCPSFGFSRRDGLVRLSLRDVLGEGIIDAHEPCFPDVNAALGALFYMLRPD
jgi:hypothetical protein